MNQEFYHTVTSEMARRMSNSTGEDFSGCIGQRVFISFLGKPISQRDFLRLSEKDIPEGEELPLIVEFQSI